MKKISKPGLPIEIYTICQNLSFDNFRKNSLPDQLFQSDPIPSSTSFPVSNPSSSRLTQNNKINSEKYKERKGHCPLCKRAMASPNHFSNRWRYSPLSLILFKVALTKFSHSKSPFLTPIPKGAETKGGKPAILRSRF